jgi:hypothetical protein
MSGGNGSSFSFRLAVFSYTNHMANGAKWHSRVRLALMREERMEPWLALPRIATQATDLISARSAE